MIRASIPLTVKRIHMHSSQLIQIAVVLCALFFLSYVVFPLLPVAVNYALVALVVGAFFIPSVSAYLLYALILLVWLKYTPMLSPELWFIAAAALFTFLIIKFFVFKRSFIAVLLFIAFFQVLFWEFFHAGPVFSSVYFYLEFLYNGALALILYGIHSSMRKL
jgi:hypothetical protein